MTHAGKSQQTFLNMCRDTIRFLSMRIDENSDVSEVINGLKEKC